MGASEVYNISNLFLRYDNEVGLLIYNRNNGFTYAYSSLAIDERIRERILEEKEENNVENTLKELLSNICLENNRLLPTKEYWPGGPQQKLEYPLTINWLISNLCTHKCPYCYAEDIIGNKKYIINNDFDKIANNIISYKPLNVVLSGGEPLLNDRISDIIGLLAQRTGITIDTNGYCFEKMKDLLPLIIKNQVHIRISLDTIRVKEISKTRPIRKKSIDNIECMDRVFKTIELLIENNVNFTIQTVLTKSNANDLESMGDKLCKMGVKVWRIFELQMNDSYREKCSKLIFDTVDDKNMRKNIYFKNKLLDRSSKYWNDMSVVVTAAKGDKNNVILVLPDGTFQTQPKHSKGKAIIDEKSPYLPTKEGLKNLSWGDHFERYID